MSDSPASSFDMLAADARWSTFSADELGKVDSFIRRWHIGPGDRVLEPGCGSGRLTEILAAQTGPAGLVHAFDASPRLMRIAEARNLPAHAILRTARAEALQLAPGSFDHIVCFNVLPHLVPLESIIGRLAASLRPGGYFWVAHTRSRDDVNALHRRGPAFLNGHILPSPRDLGALLRGAGLHQIEIEDGPDRFHAGAVRLAPGSPPGADLRA
jgi:demethylmenaquinone methyltransferase/2-methoxy-6-polyprenyl-1,4-benzoquinol methylase